MGRTPMHRAAEKGRDDAVKVLLQAGAYIYSLDKEAKTPLHLAAQNHHTHILKRILKKARCYKNQQNFLHMAALKDESNFAQMLLKNGAPVDAKDEKGQTALGYAISHGFEKTVKVLLEAGANIDSNITDVAFNNNKQSIFRILLEYAKGLSPDIMVSALFKELVTPLHVASQRGNVDVAQQLLNYKANVNAKDKQPKTPLHLAAEKGDHAMVELLLSFNADPNAMDKEKKTPLHTAVMGGHLNTVKVLLLLFPRFPWVFAPLFPLRLGICASLPLPLGNRSSLSPCLPLHPRPAAPSGNRGRYNLTLRKG
uniref:Uncharacterized protein n=1 Tax=Chelonoidis abingdonii TaxID=106734 RepID=A0A8C0GXR4_CHEAB